MNAPRIVPLAIALVLSAPISLLAQRALPVAPGDRVRVTAPTVAKERLIGTVVKLGADTCWLEVEGRASPLTLPLAQVYKLEVSRGRKSKAGTGSIVGFIGGAVTGAAIAAASIDEKEESFFSPDYGDLSDELGSIALGAALGGVAGAGVGALIGLTIKVDRWERVPLTRMRVSIVPCRGGGRAFQISVIF